MLELLHCHAAILNIPDVGNTLNENTGLRVLLV
jgi:hypothetical protein